MIVTPHFVYLHLHKSGGTFINEALMRFVPGAEFVGYHLPASMIPASCRDLPVLGFVRNPWSYYVSWFNFQLGLPRQNHLFHCMSENGALGFKDTIRRMLMLEADEALLRRVQAGLPDHFVNRGLNIPRQALGGIQGSGLGFYSFLCRYMFGMAQGAIHLGRTETLRQDLLRMLGRTGFEPTAAFRQHVESEAPSNRSRHEDFRLYYDQDLRDLVALRDAAVIRAHNYAFDSDIVEQPAVTGGGEKPEPIGAKHTG